MRKRTRYPPPPPPPPPRSSAALPWFLLVLTVFGAGVLGYLGYEMVVSSRREAALTVKACQDLETRVKAFEAERARVNAEREELEAERARLESDKKLLESRVATLEDERGNLEAELQRRDAEISELRASYESLEQRMQEELAAAKTTSAKGGRGSRKSSRR